MVEVECGNFPKSLVPIKVGRDSFILFRQAYVGDVACYVNEFEYFPNVLVSKAEITNSRFSQGEVRSLHVGTKATFRQASKMFERRKNNLLKLLNNCPEVEILFDQNVSIEFQPRWRSTILNENVFSKPIQNADQLICVLTFCKLKGIDLKDYWLKIYQVNRFKKYTSNIKRMKRGFVASRIAV